MAGAILVREGLPWVVSNTDMTIPTASGFGPGNGTLVELRRAVRRARAARWPASRSVRCSRRPSRGSAASIPSWSATGWTPTSRARVAMGWDSLLVLTGVTGLERAGRAPSRGCARRTSRPTSARWRSRSPRRTEDGSLGGWTRSGRRRPAPGRGRRERAATGGVSVAVAAWRHLDDDRPACRDRRPSTLPGSVTAMTESVAIESPRQTTGIEAVDAVVGQPRGAGRPAGGRPRRGLRARPRVAAPGWPPRPAATRPRADPCRRGACGSTPSWCAVAWPARASTPAS